MNSLARGSGFSLRSLARSALSGLSRSLAGLFRSSIGGLGGGLVGNLVGTGLNALVGRLFRRRQSVKVSNIVRAEVLNFPRMSSLDFASNPASRLFGGRAVPRGPAVTVQVEYRDGVEELVSARVAQRLLDQNALQGRY